jgi:hypothetical protein
MEGGSCVGERHSKMFCVRPNAESLPRPDSCLDLLRADHRLEVGAEIDANSVIAIVATVHACDLTESGFWRLVTRGNGSLP